MNHRSLVALALALGLVSTVAQARNTLDAAPRGASTVIIDNRPAREGSGRIVTEERRFGGATRIELRSAEPLRVLRGDRPRLTITGDDNLLALIRTEVDGETLIVEARDSYRAAQPLRVEVTLPALAALSVPGGADAEVAAIDPERFVLASDGSSRIRARGETRELVAEINGSGETWLDELRAGTVRIRLNGEGDVHLRAERELLAELNGGGDIVYRGRPETVRVETNSRGRLRHP